MKISAILFFVTTLCFLSVADGQVTDELSLTRTIALPQVHGGLNHMSVDAEHQRLFAAAPTNKTLEIVDLKSGKPWRSLEGERPAAARYAPEFNQLYVSSGQNFYIYDGRSFALMARIDLQSGLDELEYSAYAKELYVGYMTTSKPASPSSQFPREDFWGKLHSPLARRVSRSKKQVRGCLPIFQKPALSKWSIERSARLSRRGSLGACETTSQWPWTRRITGYLSPAGGRLKCWP